MDNYINEIYEKLFALFILEEMPLLEIDKMISEITGFKKEANDGQEKYVLGKELWGFDNFRLLSRANTERLKEADKEVLEALVGALESENMENEDIYEASINEARNIVKQTYKEVMCVNVNEPDKMTCLGPYSDKSFCFDNDSIVLALDLDNYTVDEIVMNKLHLIAKDMKEDLFKELSKELEVKLELFVGGQYMN